MVDEPGHIFGRVFVAITKVSVQRVDDYQRRAPHTGNQR